MRPYRACRSQRGGAREFALPASVQEALGELVHAAKEGLLALSVGVGLGVLAELMESEVEEVVRPEGQARPGAQSRYRHGQRTARSRSAGGGSRSRGRGCARKDGESEVPLRTYEHFAARDPLPASCWSRCSPASRRAGYRRTRSRSASEVEATRGRRRSRRSRGVRRADQGGRCTS